MKKIIKSLITLTFIFLSQNLLSQNDTHKFSRMYLISAAKKNGFKLVDEGGGYLDYDNIFATSLRTFHKGDQYMFVGIVENCSNCNTSIRFGLPGQIPSKLSNLDASLERSSKTNTTFIIYKNTIRNKKKFEGYFILLNNSSTKRYSYGLLFKK